MANKPLYPIFTAISGSYDLINRIVTLGLDQHWRRRAARLCLEEQPQRLLELACGTADLALMLARLAPPGTEVMGLDYSAPMLARARHKTRKLKSRHITFIEGDAAALPFPD